MNGAAVISASRRFLRKREAFWMRPSMHGFSRLVEATIELRQVMIFGRAQMDRAANCVCALQESAGCD